MRSVYVVAAAAVVVIVGVGAWIALSGRQPQPHSGAQPEAPSAAESTSTAASATAPGCDGAPDGAAREMPEIVQPWARLRCIGNMQVIEAVGDDGAGYSWHVNGQVFMLAAAANAAAMSQNPGGWYYFNYVALRPLVDQRQIMADQLMANRRRGSNMRYDTAWQLIVRTNSGLEYGLVFFEDQGDVAALLVCTEDCGMVLDVDITNVGEDSP